MLYTFAVSILSPLFKIFFKLKIFGKENFPKEGPLIVASNHVSFFDPIVVSISAPRKMNFIARESLFKYKTFANILNGLHAFPIKREKGDLNAFKLFLSKLSQEKVVLIFPEGMRSKDGNLQKPRHGVGFLEASSKATILPCYVKGSMEAWPWNSRLPKCKPISVYFGKPLNFNENISEEKRDYCVKVSERVMEEIGELKKNAN